MEPRLYIYNTVMGSVMLRAVRFLAVTLSSQNPCSVLIVPG